MQTHHITGRLLYTSFRAATPLAPVWPDWEEIEDWRREIYDRFASLVVEELTKARQEENAGHHRDRSI